MGFDLIYYKKIKQQIWKRPKKKWQGLITNGKETHYTWEKLPREHVIGVMGSWDSQELTACSLDTCCEMRGCGGQSKMGK